MTSGFIERHQTAENYANFTVDITDQFPVSIGLLVKYSVS